MKYKAAVIIAVFVALIASQAAAEPSKQSLTKAQQQSLVIIHLNLQYVNDLEARGKITTESAAKEIERLHQQALIAIAAPVEQDSLEKMLSSISPSDAFTKPGLVERLSGYITFLNTVTTLAIIIIAISIAGLAWKYFPRLLQVPLVVWEVLGYIACIGLIVGGSFITQDYRVYMAFGGCLGLFFAILATHEIHEAKMQSFYAKARINPNKANSLLLFFIWGTCAVIYESQLIGFISIISLEVFLGFTMAVSPFCYAFGFGDEDIMPKTTVASFIILCVYVIFNIFGISHMLFNPFSTGVFYLGASVFFLGLLIMSSKWYVSYCRKIRYWPMQLLAILSAIVALFLGTVQSISPLSGVGGSFIGLYILDKYVELVDFDEHWALYSFGFGLVLLLLAIFFRSNPQYFFMASAL